MIATHYETLGVDPSAPAERIRAAYRERARLHHPDRASGPADAMADLNEAYRVLSDPVRRFEYDRSIGAHGSAAGPARRGADPVDVVDRPPPPVAPSRLIPAGPARVPWKLMAVMAVVGSAVILFAATFNDPPSTEVPDGILRVGSCVEVEPNFAVREVACTGADDLVVDLVLPTDATCPTGRSQYRDRLSSATVCIETS
jgi:molecular chaperone DnaJ